MKISPKCEDVPYAWVQSALLWGFETDIEDIELMLIYSCYLKLGIYVNLYNEVYDYKHTSCINPTIFTNIPHL